MMLIALELPPLPHAYARLLTCNVSDRQLEYLLPTFMVCRLHTCCDSTTFVSKFKPGAAKM
jgi:hypothetical protein